MATDFVEWRKYLKPREWKVAGDRVELGAHQEASQFLQYNPRKVQEFKTHGIPKAGGKVRLETGGLLQSL